ncbi:hypothetical protein L7F22_022503 [Adiantum nelumboides]|nr:hypothetical protein [Adiantum nelumboides]
MGSPTLQVLGPGGEVTDTFPYFVSGVLHLISFAVLGFGGIYHALIGPETLEESLRPTPIPSSSSNAQEGRGPEKPLNETFKRGNSLGNREEMHIERPQQALKDGVTHQKLSKERSSAYTTTSPASIMTLRPAALQLALLLVALLPFFVRAADEDPLQDLCVGLSADELQQLQLPFNINGLSCKPAASVNSSDFASHQLRNPGIFTGSLGSAVNLATAATFGGLNTQGLSVARIDYNPRGINPPHVHPRATEVLFLAQGKLLVGFVTTAPDNKLFYQTIYAGDLFVFPRGLVHFQLNPDKNKPARAIAALNSQNPGASQLAVALFNSDPPLPEEVLETTLGIGDDELRRVIASVKKTLA